MDFATLVLVLVTLASTALYAVAMFLGYLARTDAVRALDNVSSALDIAHDVQCAGHVAEAETIADFASLRSTLARFITAQEAQIATDLRAAETLARLDAADVLDTRARATLAALDAADAPRVRRSDRPARPAVTAVRRIGASNAVFAQVNGAWLMLRPRSERAPAREIGACDVAA